MAVASVRLGQETSGSLLARMRMRTFSAAKQALLAQKGPLRP
jgi:hypothetical protein